MQALMTNREARRFLKRVTGQKKPYGVVQGALKLPKDSPHLLFKHKLEELGFSKKLIDRIDRWYVRVKEAHGNTQQVRASGERFFEHLFAVANLYVNAGGRRIPQIIGLFAHDSVEDTSTIANKVLYPGTYRRRAYATGLREIGTKKKHRREIITGILAVTNPATHELKTDEAKMEFVVNAIQAVMVRHGPIAFINKLCDRTHNLSTLDAKPETKERKYDETVQHLVPCFNRCAEYMEKKAKSSRKWAKEFQVVQIVGAQFFNELNKVGASLPDPKAPVEIPAWAKPDWKRLKLDPGLYLTA